MSSAFCCATGNPGRDGQSIFATDATQTPRNSRETGGAIAEESADSPAAVLWVMRALESGRFCAAAIHGANDTATTPDQRAAARTMR